MLGELPRTLEICNKKYAIRTDFRSVLKIIAAFNDENLSNEEKVFICLSRIYEHLEQIPRTKEAYEEAYRAARDFIDCRLSNDDPGPAILNWEKDEQMLFTAINKVAGTEVRTLPYLHWWSFIGFFSEIDRESLFGVVLMIRQKKSQHKNLEKNEQEFFNANRDLCAVSRDEAKKTPEDHMREMYEQLLMKGGTEDG